MYRRIKCLILAVVCILSTLGATSVASASNDMRGVWVSTVYNLDYPTTATTDSSKLKAEADEILNNCKSMGMNAIFLQVRPNSDALYKSSIFPWSAYLTGSQGTAPDNDFDPLQYWIDGAHSRGMELHAWVNPYRATKVKSSSQDALSGLASNHPAVLHPEYVIKYTDGNYYYNPALPEVRQLVIDGITEIVNNYNVDGIHMDDYFYPGTDFNDDAAYQQFKGEFTDKDDWRRNNVNLLVSGIREAIDATGKDVEFGISPAGIWANKSHNALGSDTLGNESYYSNYADTRKWALEGTVDYIAPQVYWEIGHSKADYQKLAQWWSDTLKDAPAKLYIGLADYRSYDATSGTVWSGGDEIIRQLNINKANANIDGEIHFRYKLLYNNSTLRDKVVSFYNQNPIVSGGETTTVIAEQTVAQTATQATTITTTTETTTQTTTEAATETTTQAQPTDPNAVKVEINGVSVAFDQQPVIENSRTLVPMRAIFEALDADVEWNNDTQSVIAESAEGKKITLIIGSKDMLVNNKDIVELDVPAKIMGSRTMVPLRAISEALDCTVEWNAEQRLVSITK